MKKSISILALLISFSAFAQTAYQIKQNGPTVTATPVGGGNSFNGPFNTVFALAENALPATGTIFIKSQFYNVSFLTTKAGITVNGQNTGGIHAAAKLDANATSLGTALITTQGDNCKIMNLELDGNLANQTKVDNNKTQTARLNGIVSAGKNTQVTNCMIHDFPLYGYYAILSAQGHNINKNTFYNIGWNPITFDQYTSNCNTSKNNGYNYSDVGISFYGKNEVSRGDVMHDANFGKGSGGGEWGFGAEWAQGITGNAAQFINDTSYNVKVGVYITSSADSSKITGGVLNASQTGAYLDACKGVTVLKVSSNAPQIVFLDTVTGNSIKNNICPVACVINSYASGVNTVSKNTTSK